MTEPTETVTILKKTWEEAIERELWLQALEAAGVDNWEGISEAHELFEEFKNDRSS